MSKRSCAFFGPWAVVALLVIVGLCGCGGSRSAHIGLLLPADTRMLETTRRDFETTVVDSCGDCTVLYANAKGLASRQEIQGKRLLRGGVDVLVIDPVDTRASGPLVHQARADGVPVISYEYLIEDSKPAAYVAYDDVRASELEVESLARKLRDDGHPHGPVMVQNGEPADHAYSLYRAGALSALRTAGIRIAAEHTTPFWHSAYSASIAGEMIDEIGRDGFAGAYAVTDSVASGTIKAMKRAGINPADRPTTGANATLPGLRRILMGQQYMTIYKPVQPEAAAAARLAVALAEGGEAPLSSKGRTLDNGVAQIPSLLLSPVAVTKENIVETVLADRFVTPAALCSGRVRRACGAAGVDAGP